MKLGSLFDGSGGFPLAGAMCGITPIFASEVEPYPIAVTTSRFPNMRHLGDVSRINGAEIEPVDIITFGSPCQDLSVAGKRAGLKHEANGDEETTRSGLFMEAVRTIKEMRRATNGVYPAFAVWENVPGAFSSNRGEDFRVVLEELIKIVEPRATVPSPDKGKWPYADVYVGDGWSLAYRVLDAQYWGVPQRRRRIYLVLDLRGERAGKILFERDGLRGYFEEGRTPWQATARNAGDCFETADSQRDGVAYGWPLGFRPEAAGFKAGNGAKANGIGWQEEVAPTLSAAPSGTNQAPSVCIKEQHLFENHSQDTRYRGPLDVAPIVSATFGMGGNNQPFVVEETIPIHDHPVYCLQGNGIDRADTAGCNGKGWNDEVCYTLNTIDRPAVAYAIGNGQLNQISMAEQANTLDCMHDKQAVLIEEPPIVLDRAFYNQGQNAQYDPQFYTDGTVPTLVAKGPSAVAHKTEIRYIVRRLTPTECARLQGFPDTWGHINPKEDFTDEEYSFWLEVRNTHAAINGKTTKEYTKQQMLTWYNKLHTDSAEYKMWGNGIALPTALYVMQGIADALNRGE